MKNPPQPTHADALLDDALWAALGYPVITQRDEDQRFKVYRNYIRDGSGRYNGYAVYDSYEPIATLQIHTITTCDEALAITARFNARPKLVKVYHTSDARFDFPSFEIADEKTEKPGKAHLGFYVGMTENVVRDLGCNYIYELTLEIDDANTRSMSFDTMVSIYNWIGQNSQSPKDSWIGMRLAHQSVGTKLVKIVEGDGKVGESVITDLSCIKNFKLIATKK